MNQRRTKKKRSLSHQKRKRKTKSVIWTGLPGWITSAVEVDPGPPVLKKYFWFSAAFILLATLFLSLNSGVNEDDSFRNWHSDKIVSFYTTFGKDTSSFHHPDADLKYYGGMFEIFSGSLNRILNYTSSDPGYHHVRHLLNGVFGFAAMLFLSLWLRIWGGWLPAIMGLWMIFLSPRFLGHSLMNPKDIPFATGYIITLYYLAKSVRIFPEIKFGDMAGLAVGFGIAMGIRAGGLILLGYIGLFFGLRWIDYYRKIKSRQKTGSYKKIVYVFLAILAGLILGILFWPYAIFNPFKNILESLAVLSAYPKIIQVLFSGDLIFGDLLPWHYHLTWIKNTVPLYIIIGTFLAGVLIRRWSREYGLLDLILAILSFVFPIFYIIWKGSILYDGWRHILFVYPSLVFLASAGWYILLRKYYVRNYLRIAFIGLLLVTSLQTAWFIVRNLDFPYIYFNPIAGGMDGAFGRFETDYWGLSTKPAVEWLKKEGIIQEGMLESVRIVSNFDYTTSINLADVPRVTVEDVLYRDRHTKAWDYGIFLTRYVSGEHLRNGIWPTHSRLLHTIESDGVPIAVILKNEENRTFQAYQANQEGSHPFAIGLLLSEVENYPDDEFSWNELGIAYQKVNNFDGAVQCYLKVLEIDPHNLKAHNFLARTYMQSGREDQAVYWFEKSLEIVPNNSYGLYYLGLINLANQNLQKALRYALGAIRAEPGLREAYQLAARIYDGLGQRDEAQRYREAANRIE